MAKKYIEADRLKAKIESLKSLEYPCDNSEQNFGFEYALDRLSDSLDSLQQEQPCNTCTNDKGCVTCKDGELWEGKPEVDLEKEIEDFLASEDSTSYENAGAYKVSFKDPKKVARHFYELGKQAKKEE